jgi:hypothetical protein
MARELNVNKESIRSIITTELGKRKNYAKFMPHSLHEEEKLRQLVPYKDFVQRDVGESGSLNIIINGDGPWCF